MALTKVYKPGQGYYTRMLSGIGAGAITLAGVAWLSNRLEASNIAANKVIWVQAGLAVGIIAVVGGLLWYLLNKPRIADFMIHTEAEMRKVNWPTRREIVGSTWIVICGTFMIAALLFVVDLAFGQLFMAINILQTAD